MKMGDYLYVGDQEMVGQEIEKVVACQEGYIITMTNKTFVTITADEGVYGGDQAVVNVSGHLDPWSWGDRALIAAGFTTQEERDANRKARQEEYKRQREVERRRKYESLKKEFGDE